MVFPVKAGKGYRLARRNDMGNLRPILAAAGCPGDLDRPWHAMRHTFITLFCEAGGGEEALRRIVAHGGSGNDVTAGYLHVNMDYLARELARMTLRPAAPTNVIPLHPYRQTA